MFYRGVLSSFSEALCIVEMVCFKTLNTDKNTNNCYVMLTRIPLRYCLTMNCMSISYPSMGWVMASSRSLQFRFVTCKTRCVCHSVCVQLNASFNHTWQIYCTTRCFVYQGLEAKTHTTQTHEISSYCSSILWEGSEHTLYRINAGFI